MRIFLIAAICVLTSGCFEQSPSSGRFQTTRLNDAEAILTDSGTGKVWLIADVNKRGAISYVGDASLPMRVGEVAYFDRNGNRITSPPKKGDGWTIERTK